MNLTTYTDFSRAQTTRAGIGRIPLLGTIEVTLRCPLDCSHCYNNLPMADGAAREGELTTAEHFALLDELAAAGCLWLLFTGGEIFARKDFLEIYTYAKKKGFLITLFTNGTLINERIADYLAKYRPFNIEITLYGYTEATYEALTGVKGSYARCLRAIDLLVERKLPLKLKTVGVSTNQHEIPQMEAFARERGLYFKYDSMINPRTDKWRGAVPNPQAVRLLPEEIVALDLRDERRLTGWKEFAARTARPANPKHLADEVYHCGGAVTSFAIDPQGKLSLCVLSQNEKYDLRKGTFKEGWETFLLGVRRTKITRPTKCVACNLKSMCGMCPANGELEHGDKEQPVDFMCKVAHMRAHAIGATVPPHGDCEYCADGAKYEEVVALVARAKAGESQSTTRRLPMIKEEGAGTTGCGSCH